jgi:DNA-binding transcriptional LysR family regulator
MDLMQTRHLKTLVQIERVGSFAKAASQLNMTLSTLSMQMKSLEAELNIVLFDRTHRPPKLTPQGREIAEKAARVLEAEAALLESTQETTGLSGNYRIGFVATASVRLLPLFLKNASTKAPNAKFELETALSEELEYRVLSGQLDAAILTASKRSEAGLQYNILREEALVYAVPHAFDKKSIEETAQNLPFIQFNPSSGIGKVIYNHTSKLTATSEKQPIVLDSVEAIMECVNEGIGFTLLAEPDIKRYATNKVIIKKTRKKNATRQLVLATPKRDKGEYVQTQLLALFAR